MLNTILRKLSTLSVEYGTQHSNGDLVLLAEDWTRELADEHPESVAAAFDMHRRECSRFPTLSHIMALLPRCRSAEHCGAPELPEYTTANNGPNRAAQIARALRGDADARAALDALVRRAAGRCAA